MLPSVLWFARARDRPRIQSSPRIVQQPVIAYRHFLRAGNHACATAPASLAKPRTPRRVRSAYRVARVQRNRTPRTTPRPSHSHGLPRRRLGKLFRPGWSGFGDRDSSSRITRHIAPTKPLKRSQHWSENCSVRGVLRGAVNSPSRRSAFLEVKNQTTLDRWIYFAGAANPKLRD